VQKPRVTCVGVFNVACNEAFVDEDGTCPKCGTDSTACAFLETVGQNEDTNFRCLLVCSIEHAKPSHDWLWRMAEGFQLSGEKLGRGFRDPKRERETLLNWGSINTEPTLSIAGRPGYPSHIFELSHPELPAGRLPWAWRLPWRSNMHFLWWLSQ
jgi:hypothetical protein